MREERDAEVMPDSALVAQEVIRQMRTRVRSMEELARQCAVHRTELYRARNKGCKLETLAKWVAQFNKRQEVPLVIRVVLVFE